MSLQAGDNVALVLNNNLNVSDSSTKLVRIGGTSVTQYEIPADSGSGPYNSQILFSNIVTPNLATNLVSRNIRVHYTVSVTYPQNLIGMASPTYVASDTTGLNVVNASLRQFPLNSVLDTLSVVINGSTTSMNSRQVMSAIMRVINQDYLRQQASECPSMPDNATLLSADSVFVPGAQVVAGTPIALTNVSNQPLSKYQNSCGYSRGSFSAITKTNDGANDTWTFECEEPLLISPLTLSDEETYLANVNTLSVQLNFSNLKDMVSVQGLQIGGAAFNPANLTITLQNAYLSMSYVTVDSSIVTIPRAVSYPWENVVYFTQPQGGVDLTTANAPYVIQSQTLRLQAMPSKIYAWVRPQITNRNPLQTDSFLAIGQLGNTAGTNGGLSVTLGNRSGLLSSASIKTLYRISRRNGYNGSYMEWYNQGGILILDPVQDLGVNVSQGDGVPGEISNVNLQIQLTVNTKNYVANGINANAFTPANNNCLCEFMIAVVYSGTAVVTTDQTYYNLGDISPQELAVAVSTAPKDGTMLSSESVKPTIQGGSLFGQYKQVLGHVASASKMLKPSVDTLLGHLRRK